MRSKEMHFLRENSWREDLSSLKTNVSGMFSPVSSLHFS